MRGKTRRVVLFVVFPRKVHECLKDAAYILHIEPFRFGHKVLKLVLAVSLHDEFIHVFDRKFHVVASFQAKPMRHLSRPFLSGLVAVIDEHNLREPLKLLNPCLIDCTGTRGDTCDAEAHS
ncbi:MAG: hypothetical protein A4E63_01023 [Syntrophorhabdus sp. PtaU1.Bin050]|nr:MAG: hypothetical protein A4E63_01023 [Syntrophorhabdus sp. PtaU1.Bin050]